MHKNGIFLTPVKYTLVCHTPKVSWFLGPHDTLSCVMIKIKSHNQFQLLDNGFKHKIQKENES